MIDRFFEKYARAVSDERERKKLYNLFCARTIIPTAFYIVCAAVIAEALIFGDAFSAGDSVAPFLIFGLTVLLWIALAIASLVLWAVFRSTYRKILNRDPSPDEMPEVTSYRQKVRETQKGLLKSTAWAIGLFALGCVCMVVMIAFDFALHPESEDLTYLSGIGIGVFAVCLFVFCFALLIVRSKRASEGKTAELQTEKEAKIIDEAQGRKHRYSLQEDNNAQSYRYLFPSRNLLAEVQSLAKKRLNATLISVSVSCVVGIAVAVVCFSPLLFDWGLAGYAFPVFMTIVLLGTYFSILPFEIKQSALEKKQKEILETYPIYKKNLALYKKYEKFSKGKGKVLLIIVIAAFALSYVLAILFPNQLYSLIPTALLFVGICENNLLLAGLRQEAKPIEDEIDRTRGEIKFRISDGESDAYQNVRVGRGPDGALSSDGKECSCRLELGKEYRLFLDIDRETKRIVGLSIENFGAKTENGQIRETMCAVVGGMYFDEDRDIPDYYGQEAEFDNACLYDSENKTLLFGKRDGNSLFCKIFQNVYVQVGLGGALNCILITGV